MDHLSKTFLIASSIIFVVFLIFQPIYNADAALVPCGRAGQPACTTCDIFVLASDIINFVLFTVTPATAVLLYLVAGFMILMGGANPGLITSGKNIFKTTTYGLFIVFGAWMITNTVLKSLAGNSQFTKDWNKVTCTGTTGTGTAGTGIGGTGTGSAVSGVCSPSLALASITDPAALAMENGATIVWASSDQNVQKNLTKLQQEFNKLQNLIQTQFGGSATEKSVYRSLAYQTHFFDLFKNSQQYKGNLAYYNNNPACAAEIAVLKAEQQKHGICNGANCLVASPNKCTAPHVRGMGVDISISPSTLLSSINTVLQSNNIDLRWQALPSDPIHFNLVNPPFTGCAS